MTAWALRESAECVCFFNLILQQTHTKIVWIYKCTVFTVLILAFMDCNQSQPLPMDAAIVVLHQTDAPSWSCVNVLSLFNLLNWTSEIRTSTYRIYLSLSKSVSNLLLSVLSLFYFLMKILNNCLILRKERESSHVRQWQLSALISFYPAILKQRGSEWAHSGRESVQTLSIISYYFKPLPANFEWLSWIIWLINVIK